MTDRQGELDQTRSADAPELDTLATAGGWRTDELSAILHHQLDSPLSVDLFNRLSPGDQTRFATIAAEATPPLKTFRELLNHPCPPLELLGLARQFARRPATTRHVGLPSEVRRALAAALAAAELVHKGIDGDEALFSELLWLRDSELARPELRELAGSAISLCPLPGVSAPNDSKDARAVRDDSIAFAPTVDGYQIVGKLGEGGMGAVWKAVQLSTGRIVALKLMSAASFGSERARRRFTREVRLNARLKHPQIAGVYESGLHRGAYYYAMELVDGVPLDQHARERKLDDRQILALVRSVCSAVDHAHRLGIVHRDLKPGNIMVDRAGVPHILDFGLAKAAQEVQTSALVTLDGELAGTLAFMAPELAAGLADGRDVRVDVYAIGVMLFNLLAESYPHDLTGTRMDVLRRISEVEPRRLQSARPDADPGLDALLSAALARNPEDRYATAGDLADALDRYLAGTVASPRRRRRVRRPVLKLTALVVLLAFASVLAVKFWPPSPASTPTQTPEPPASAPIDGGPWIAGPIYANPGKPFTLRLGGGRLHYQVQRWRIDWGAENQVEEFPAEARTAQHIYPNTGRFMVRAFAMVYGSWHIASTANHPIHRWPASNGGNDCYYTLTNRRGMWTDVLDESWSRNGALVSILNEREQSFLERTFLPGDQATTEWLWIGLTELPLHRTSGGNSDYIWSDDSDYKYKNWAAGKPSDPAHDNSAAMNHARVAQLSAAKTGEWSDLKSKDMGFRAQGILKFKGQPPNELLVVVRNSEVPPEIEPEDYPPSTPPATTPARMPSTRTAP